ncbi:MAG: hypothetical protein AABW50_03025 [Nanoarchaeota archaeon]
METEKTNEMKGGKKTDYEFIVQVAIVAVLVLLLAYNFGKSSGGATGNAIGGLSTGIGTVSASEIIPTGIPEVYGAELKVNYDDVSANNPQTTEAAIQKLSAYEDKQLTKEQMDRYVKIGSSISCEYCCGAQSLIFSNGQRACGCAHSYAMRGLAKYLLINHPDMTDEKILSELGKWKVLFFPGVHEQKAQALKAKDVDPTNYINLASNLYRGAEKGQAQTSGGGMVGGC